MNDDRAEIFSALFLMVLILSKRNLSILISLFMTYIYLKNYLIIKLSEKYIFSDTLIASDVNFHTVEKLTEPLRAQAKIRYAAKPADCTIYPVENGCAKLVFDTPQRAITPGQSVVFYDGNVLLGGGIIEKAIFSE